MEFLSYLISGISLGSVYAIIALGYTMVYGIAKMLNFAHGDVIMVGAYICFFACTKFNLPPIVGVILAMIVCTVLGMTIEKLAYKPLRAATSLAVLITAIGVSYFLQNSALLIWKAAARVYPPVVEGTASLFGGQLSISYISLLTIAVCVVIMLALTTFVNKSKMGKAMRACSEDKAAAQLMGINVNTTISMTFAIGSALAAVAGALLCSSYPTLHPTTGAMPGIKAFVAAVFHVFGDRQHVQAVVPRFADAEFGRAVAVGVDRVGVQVGFVDVVAVHLGQYEFRAQCGAAPGVARDVGIVGGGVVALRACGACRRECGGEKQQFFHGVVFMVGNSWWDNETEAAARGLCP